MSRRTLPVLVSALLASALAVVPGLTTSASAAPAHGERAVCATPQAGYAACDAHVRTLVGRDGTARPDATSGPSGYSPAQLRTAYGLGAGASTTVAIVDAYAHPNALSDLNAYRTAFGIPTVDATTFRQVNQNGASSPLPNGDVGWGQEEMLDLEMVSAICPSCSILYVAGNSASFADLGAAVTTAGRLGAKVISNSYGGAEFSGETNYAGAYNQPGVAITASAGDSGYGAQVPAAYNTVTAVGGTSLVLNGDGTRQSETVWSGTGSGCSSVIAKPSWQSDPRCARRTIADVAADADPATGVSVYDSYGSSGSANWYVFGGTSVAAPIIAGVYALSGNTSGIPAQLAYKAPAGSLYDVTSGSNSRRCRSGYLCQAAVGYDGPTGMGTPNGTAAF